MFAYSSAAGQNGKNNCESIVLCCFFNILVTIQQNAYTFIFLYLYFCPYSYFFFTLVFLSLFVLFFTPVFFSLLYTYILSLLDTYILSSVIFCLCTFFCLRTFSGLCVFSKDIICYAIVYKDQGKNTTARALMFE